MISAIAMEVSSGIEILTPLAPGYFLPMVRNLWFKLPLTLANKHRTYMVMSDFHRILVVNYTANVFPGFYC